MTDLAALVERARTLASSGRRSLLGITGPPGAGKSTVAQALVSAVAPAAVLVAMDGFHLAQVELERLGRAARKGAIDTFDADGFVSLLRRLHAADEPCVYAPEFRRDLEEPVAGAVPVPQSTPLVVVEGNYLLARTGVWATVRALFDEIWYLDLETAVRHERLIERHVAFGRSVEAARAWALGTDERNAQLIAATKQQADLVVTMR